VTLPGVGEALKREIAGLVLVDQPWLWGFEGQGCSESGWARGIRGACAGDRIIGFAGFLPICATSCGFQHPSHWRYLDLRMPAGPQAV